MRDDVDVLAVSSTSTDQQKQTPDRMWSADVAALSVDGWQPNEDAVVMRFHRLVTIAIHHHVYGYEKNKCLLH